MKTSFYFYNQVLLLTTLLIFSASLGAQTSIIVDNVDPGFSCIPEWQTGTFATDRYGTDYRFRSTAGSNSASDGTATWQTVISETGYYDVATMHSAGANRATDAPFTVIAPYGNTTIDINQSVNGGVFQSLGTYHFNAGDTARVDLNTNAVSGKVVMADAIRFTRLTTNIGRKEYRFFWVSRFQWPDFSETVSKQNIDHTFQTAMNYNFNGVFFQVRGQMDTLYPSLHEPWTSTFGWTNPGWDPLAYAINAAHSRGIKLHAYINTHTLAGPVPPASTSPQHQYNIHGKGSPPGSERWEIHDAAGVPVGSTDGYTWLSPGIPEASYRTRREILHVVENYDIDGVHFDRIRTPMPDTSHDPVSEARFAGDGNPHGLSYNEWTRDQITRDLRNIYGAIQYTKPQVEISATPIGISRRNSSTHYQGVGSNAWYNYNQDGWAWLQASVVDFLVPQIYWEVGSAHPYEKILADWMANAGERWIVPGSRTNRTISGDGAKPLAGLLGERQQAEDQGAAGNCFWNRDTLFDVPPGENQSFLQALKAGPYQNVVSPPAMPWKTAPTTGYITGYIRDENNNPVVDARVTLEGDEYAYLSAWDGFFTILNVPTSTPLTLTATKNTLGSARFTVPAIAAGEVSSHTLNLSSHRGFVEFIRTRYYHDDTAQIRLFDADLTGQPTAQAHISTEIDAAGETVTLTAQGGGRFTGSIALLPTSGVSGDGSLLAMPGNTLTVTYMDSNNGSGNSAQSIASAQVIVPRDIFLESRLPNGNITPSTLYSESGTGWNNTGSINTEVIKSLAPGLNGQGGRYSNDSSAYYRYFPTINASGHYDVYITLPGKWNQYNSPGTKVQVVPGGPLYTVDLSSSNSSLKDQWLLIAEDVELHKPGTIIRVENHYAGTSGTQVFGSDALRLVFRRPIGVNANVKDWSLY